MAEEKRVKKVTLIPSKRHLRKTRVAAYIRVSSKKEIQNGSYETQAKYYEDKIRSNPEWDFAGIYGDRESGTHTENREGFQQLIRDALDKKVDIIICKSVSRWARNTIEGLRTIKELTGNFVNLIFEEENIDTRHLGYQLQLNLQQVVAQMESESISENLKWSYRNRAELGLFTAARGKYFGFNTLTTPSGKMQTLGMS
jgi:DNA invertase Pin-like site-specific DNA recombinase